MNSNTLLCAKLSADLPAQSATSQSATRISASINCAEHSAQSALLIFDNDNTHLVSKIQGSLICEKVTLARTQGLLTSQDLAHYLYHSQSYSLILLNLDLIDNTDPIAMQYLTSVSQTVPMVAFSGNCSSADRIFAYSMGCVDYICTKTAQLELEVRLASHIKRGEMKYQDTRLAYTDELTGLFNRRGYNQAMTTQWDMCRRDSKPLILFMVDVDNFKQFNDKYGHANGDKLLIKVAEVFKHIFCRTTDTLARFGGDEFVILASGLMLSTAKTLANKLNKDINSIDLSTCDVIGVSNISISIGVAICVPDANMTINGLFEQADQSLYDAKKQGKNKWVFCQA